MIKKERSRTEIFQLLGSDPTLLSLLPFPEDIIAGLYSRCVLLDELKEDRNIACSSHPSLLHTKLFLFARRPLRQKKFASIPDLNIAEPTL